MTRKKIDTHTETDVAIIGAGPIGLELAILFQRAKLNYIQFEAKQIGYTMSWWPRNTHFFSPSEHLTIARVPIPNAQRGRITGEEYLAYLQAIVKQFDLKINKYEKVIDIIPQENQAGFTLQTEALDGNHTYHCKSVVLAKGDMDHPNWLNIPGEDMEHVSHYFEDPHFYFQRRVLIVGGKNSAVEAALRCWRAGAEVILSYRRSKFSQKVTQHLRAEVEAQIRNKAIQFYPNTIPKKITPCYVILNPTKNGQPIEDSDITICPADFVLLCTGFRADMSLYEAAGVKLEGKRQIPSYNPQTMETNVPGLYIAGTTAAGILQDDYQLSIENSHEHVAKIVAAITKQLDSQSTSDYKSNVLLPSRYLAK